MMCSARSVALRLLCQAIVKQNLLVKTTTVAHVSSFGSSLETANDYETYTVISLKEKAEKYLTQTVPDTAQASEKTSMAAKRALKDYVEKLQTIHQVEIVPPNIVTPWSSGTLERLFRLINKKIDQKKKAEFINGWTSAFNLHARGWNENMYSADVVRVLMPLVFRMIEIVENELPTTAEMAHYLKENLFFVKPLEVIKHEKKIIQEDELIAFVANTFGIKSGMKHEQVNEIIGCAQKELDRLNCKIDVKKVVAVWKVLKIA